MIASALQRYPLARSWLVPVLVYAVAALLILGPALQPGYLLIVDMIAVPRPGPGLASDGTFLLNVVEYALAHLMPADTAQKLTLFAVLFLTGLGAHLLAQRYLQHPLAAYSGGLLYLFNPAVSERFFYGQWLVILGWGLLPWLLIALRTAARAPGFSSGLAIGAIAGILLSWSPHSVFFLLILGIALVIGVVTSPPHRACLLRGWRERRVWVTGGGAALAALALMLPWVLPTITAHSGLQGYLAAQTPSVLARETTGFATVGDPIWGTLGNVLTGYGFWAESTGRFISSKTWLPEWPLFIALWPVLNVAGLVWRWRSGDRVMTVALAIAAPISVALAIGVSSPLTRPLSATLFAHVPLYSGLRDTDKWAGVLLLAYAYFVAGAADALLAWVSEWYQSALPAAMTLCVLVPLLPGVGLLFGGWGQAQPVSYPSSWEAADRILARQVPRGATVFLPWHLYLMLPFTRHVVANPAPPYFSRPIIISDDEEMGLTQAGYARAELPQQRAVARLLLIDHPDVKHLAHNLAHAGICGIMLAVTVDWARYRFVIHAPHLRAALQTPDLMVFVVDDARCR